MKISRTVKLITSLVLIAIGVGQGYYFTFSSVDYGSNQEIWIATSTIAYITGGILMIGLLD